MRNLIDSIVKQMFTWCFHFLWNRYDFFFDGLEIWIREKIPVIDDISEV